MSTGIALSKCMRLRGPGESLIEESRQITAPRAGEVVLKVHACGVCRTDLHVVDGDIGLPVLPIVPGHEVVGEVVAAGAGVSWPVGTRLGVPWLGSTCGRCQYCTTGQENLCDSAQFTGYQLDGGYAEHIVANAAYCFEIPASMDAAHAAPLLCAGLIGYRSLRMTGDAQRIGLYGFGAAAHIIAQIAVWQGREVYAFTRPGDTAAQEFALQLAVRWAGDSDRAPPVLLDAAIIFAPVGALVPPALRALRKGGTLVCAGIHMSDLPSFPYSLLWGERVIRSVANLTRRDGIEFLELAPRVPVRTHVEIFPLSQANLALERLRAGKINGAAVLVP
ncbi:MAG TPA: zinc-dependent alcohol dehydrogenase family protein [Steroidobacter sp.]